MESRLEKYPLAGKYSRTFTAEQWEAAVVLGEHKRDKIAYRLTSEGDVLARGPEPMGNIVIGIAASTPEEARRKLRDLDYPFDELPEERAKEQAAQGVRRGTMSPQEVLADFANARPDGDEESWMGWFQSELGDIEEGNCADREVCTEILDTIKRDAKSTTEWPADEAILDYMASTPVCDWPDP